MDDSGRSNVLPNTPRDVYDRPHAAFEDLRTFFFIFSLALMLEKDLTDGFQSQIGGCSYAGCFTRLSHLSSALMLEASHVHGRAMRRGAPFSTA